MGHLAFDNSERSHNQLNNLDIASQKAFFALLYMYFGVCVVQNIKDAKSRGTYRKVDKQPSDFALFIDNPHPDLGAVLRENPIF